MSVHSKNLGSGIVRLFVKHPTASNLLMIAMILIGSYCLTKINIQFFPTVEIPRINVTIAWPGASASDVEENILNALEPELRFLDGINKVDSYAIEGLATIAMEFKADTDMQKAQSDVEQAVARITTLPQDSEEPVIQRLAFYEPVARISISGPFSESSIKAYAKQIRDGLLAAGIDKVDVSGSRDEEIWVRLKEYDLQRLNLNLSEIATTIRNNTKDQPSGTAEGQVDVQLRAVTERKTPHEIGQIEVKSLKTGEKVLLKDIATIEKTFDKEQKTGYIKGVPGIELQVKRAPTANTLKTMETLNKYVEDVTPTLPASLKIQVYQVQGKLVQQRLGILVKNGLQGLVLVLIVLFIFLNARIAFWVAAGIPVAILGTLAVMYLSGQSINMVSMFALLLMLGIIVDDAIVVGEHTATRQAMGDSRLIAAELGATKMLAPVVAATLTTQAAFFPIFLISDTIGDILSAIPLVVVAVLTASLIECFLILPGHLRHGFGKVKKPSRFRKAFDDGLNSFRDGPYKKFVTASYNWRYTTVAMTIASLILSAGLLAGDRVKFVFFPSPEPENFSAWIEFSAGLPSDVQVAALAKIETSLDTTEKKLAKKDEKLVVTTFTTLGQAGIVRGDNLAQIDVQMTASEERTTLTKDVIAGWKKDIPEIPGVERITLHGARVGPPGRDIDVRLQNGTPEVLKQAADDLKEILKTLKGVTAISDNLPYGKPELIMELTPRGRALGFTSENLGAQVRNAFEGAIATRFAEGDEEITVRVKQTQEIPGVQALQQLYLKSPSGKRVPLSEVVTTREQQGFAIIQRSEGIGTVAVTANVDNKVTNNTKVTNKLLNEVLPPLAKKYDITYTLKGRAEERNKSFADLQLGGLLALSLIYIILAWVFESYAKPFAVMAIIPFGFVGALIGHMLLGYNLTIVSLIGLLGLSGILVNDSIVLVSQANERSKHGQDLATSAIGASLDRLRAVILTSLTTIGGLLPLLFETSRQAQFLIPMAITLVFGLAAATLLVLILVPALLGIGGDIGNVFRYIVRLYLPNAFNSEEEHKPGTA